MHRRPRTLNHRHFNVRSLCRRGAILAGLLALLVTGPACDDAISQEFRGAALSSIESGVQSIATGVIDGIFSIVEPDDATGGTSG